MLMERVEPGFTGVRKIDNQTRGWFITIIALAIIATLFIVLRTSFPHANSGAVLEEDKTHTATTSDNIHVEKSSSTIELVTATVQSPASTILVPATVEPNQKQLQQITPLVSGRIREIFVSLGDRVKSDTLLLRIDSPQVAEMHGKLHEAETRLLLARMTLARVQQAANKVLVLKAKASLDEAESTLNRMKQLNSEGLIARKDVVAAQSQFDRAQAEYNFQKDISLNREVAEANANFTTAQTEVQHIRDGLRALDARLPPEGEGNEHDISTIELRSPIAGVVIERFVNPGSGFEAGKPLLTIANTKTLWVIANVPASQMSRIYSGMSALVILDSKKVSGKIGYIDPRLNEDTRTSRVRVEISNPTERISVGSFAQIELQIPATSSANVFVPEAAVQTIDGKSAVFVSKAPGEFSVRMVDAGPAIAGMVPIQSGLQAGERIAAKGSFILKSKLLKENFGDSD